MKTFEQFINEDVIIQKIDWINLKNILQKYKVSNKLKENLDNVSESDKYKNYPILMAVKGDTIVGYFYKYLGGNENLYDDGFVQSDGTIKNIGSKLLSEMKKLGKFTTFCDIGNISSLKMHFKAQPSKIICITDSSPDKDNGGQYKKEISNIEYKNILESGRLYYDNGNEKCLLFKNNIINTEVIDFVLNNLRIDLMLDNKKLDFKKDEISQNLKYYILY